MKTCSELIVLLSIILCAYIGNSQELPEIEAADIDDFSDYPTNPSFCVERTFTDKTGRLWLASCGLGFQLSVFLYSFDGYTFQIPSIDFSQLNSSLQLVDMRGGYELFGMQRNIDHDELVRIDLDSQVVYTYELPDGKLLLDLYTTEDEVILMTLSGNLLEIVSFSESLFSSKYQMEVSPKTRRELSLRQNFLLQGGEFWVGDVDHFKLIHVNFNTNQRWTFDTKNWFEYIEENGEMNSGYSIRSAQDVVYLIGKNYQNRIVYKLDRLSSRFYRIAAATNTLREFNVFEDKIGNVLQINSTAELRHEAVLTSPQGKSYNCSKLFESLIGYEIKSIQGDDFFNQLITSNPKGILIQKVRLSNPIKRYLDNISIRTMVNLDNDNILIETQFSGSFILNKKTKSIREHNFKYKIGYRNIFALTDDRFLATENRHLISFNSEPDDIEYLWESSVDISSFCIVGSSLVAILNARGHLFLYDLIKKTSEPIVNNGDTIQVNSYAHDMVCFDGYSLWIATSSGLINVTIDGSHVESIQLNAQQNNPAILCIKEDREENLWLGTALNGIVIFNPETNNVSQLNSEQGLANNTVVDFSEDKDGDMWISTFKGVSVATQDGELLANLYEADGLVFHESNRYASYCDNDGLIYVGSLKGLSVIDPVELKKSFLNRPKFDIFFTSLDYFSRAHNVKLKESSIFSKQVDIILPPEHRDVHVEFALSNLQQPFNNKYAYRNKLKSQGWIEIGNQHQLSLNDLQAGTHLYEFRGSDGGNNWTMETILLSIQVREYFYKRTWFYILTGLLLTGIGILWIQSLRVQVKRATNKINSDKELIEEQAEELKKMDLAKSKFFTNISHEIRTPLTIISGILDQIKEKPDKWLNQGVSEIKRQTSHMLSLINQILELRTLESRSLELKLIQGNVVEYIAYLVDSYQLYAKNARVNLHFNSMTDELVMDYDPDKLLKIVTNLLSNAIKYNRQNGDVWVKLDQSEETRSNTLILTIKDSGDGIPQEEIGRVFDRYYQVKKADQSSSAGSGIGLALTKELVQLMNGNIDLNSEVGMGTEFVVQLPIVRNSETITKYAKTNDATIVSESFAKPKRQLDGNKIYGEGSSEVLVVEDNDEILELLVNCLSNHFKVSIARNGEQGTEKAFYQVPDIIISDVMMPKKTGLELCQELKEDIRTSHIPIILLTAKVDIESKLLGLRHGADAYLSKPFNRKELLIRMQKLLELRKRLQQIYQARNPLTPLENASSPEDEFIQSVRSVILENLDDESFGITQLCRAIRLSRSQVHNKLKAITGESTSIYIRSIRMAKAQEYLLNTEMNVSEVGYACGFKNPTYFSNVYSKHFGYPPSKTRM